MDIRLLLISILALIWTPARAYSPVEGNIYGIVGPTLMQTNFRKDSGQPSPASRIDGGFLVQGDINQRASLEIALFHFNKSFFRSYEDRFTAEEIEMMQVGLGYRHWLGSKVSFGILLTSSFAMTEPNFIHRQPADNNLETSGRDVTEYGFDFSLQRLFFETPMASGLIDFRYNRNFTSRVGESGDHYLVMIAYRYFIQGK